MTPLSLSGAIGSIKERADGREPREGPKLGMATGMPEENGVMGLALGVKLKSTGAEGFQTWRGDGVVCGRGGQTQVTGTH